MQILTKEINPAIHDCYRALTIQQPKADLLIAGQSVLLQSRNINYRGEILICSSANTKDNYGMIYPERNGVTIGLAELYDTKPVAELTEEELAGRERPNKGYGWFFRNQRRVVEMPIIGKLGLYTVVVPKGDITEYPQNLIIGDKTFKEIQNELRRNEHPRRLLRTK